MSKISPVANAFADSKTIITFFYYQAASIII